jgi:type VI secretion system secreted protein VgrG
MDLKTKNIKLELKKHELRVTEFNLTGCTFNSNYKIRAKVVSQKLLSANTCLNNHGKFIFSSEKGKTYWHGHLVSLEEIGAIQEGFHYIFHFRSPFHLFQCKQKNRIFLNKSAFEIIQEIIESASWRIGVHFKFLIKHPSLPLEFIRQYHESDADFISRLCAEHGLIWMIEQTSDMPCCIFTDSSDLFHSEVLQNKVSLISHGCMGLSKDMLINMDHTRCLLPNEISVGNFSLNHLPLEFSSTKITNSSIPCVGTHNIFGEGQENILATEKLAQQKIRAIDCEREYFNAETNSEIFRLGQALEINAPVSSGHYRVIGIDLKLDEKSKVPHAHLRLLPLHQAFQAATKPMLLGSFEKATIYSKKDGEVDLDDQGRYRVRYPFDAPDNPGLSHRIPFLQYNAGTNTGCHFPLPAGTSVMLAYLNGNINRPVIVGSLANDISILTSENAYQHIFQTPRGDQLIFDDTPENAFIRFASAHQQNSLTLSAQENNESISLQSQDGSIEINAGNNTLINCKKTTSYHVGNSHHIQVKGKALIKTLQGDFSMTADSADILVAAEKSLFLRSNKGEFQAENLTYHAGEGLFLNNSTGDVSVSAGKNFTVSANNILCHSDSDISFVCGASSLSFSSGAISFDCLNLEFHGSVS